MTVDAGALLMYLLATVRLIAWFLIVPPFSTRAFPMTAKVILACGLALLVAPAIMTQTPPASDAAVIGAIVSQVLIGLLLGFVTMLLFAAITTAGAMIDQFGGLALAQAFDPLMMQMNTVFGKFHQMLATVLLFVTGAHLLVLGGVMQTFELLPVGQPFDVAASPDPLLTAFRLFFVTAVQIALPLIAVLFVADLGLALLTKVAPQLNAITVMFPAKIGLTLLLVGLTFPALSDAVARLAELALEAMAAIAGGTGGGGG